MGRRGRREKLGVSAGEPNGARVGWGISRGFVGGAAGVRESRIPGNAQSGLGPIFNKRFL